MVSETLRNAPLLESDLESVVQHIVPELLRRVTDITPDPIRRGPAPNSKQLELNHGAIAVDWIIKGTSIPELADKYFSVIEDPALRIERVVQYLSDVFDYKLPWALTAFGILCEEYSEDSVDSLYSVSQLKFLLEFLPSYFHFGVSSVAAAYLSILGVQSREVARYLGSLCSESITSGPEVVEWVANLEPLDIEPTAQSLDMTWTLPSGSWRQLDVPSSEAVSLTMEVVLWSSTWLAGDTMVERSP